MSAQYAPSSLAALEHRGWSEKLNQTTHVVHKISIALSRLALVLIQLC
jgi:hypothetical protein